MMAKIKANWSLVIIWSIVLPVVCLVTYISAIINYQGKQHCVKSKSASLFECADDMGSIAR